MFMSAKVFKVLLNWSYVYTLIRISRST